MFDWQDLRFFSVLARLGSLSAAARELGVDHATVGRRVASLEKSMGLRLVDRLPRSCPLTEDGRAIATFAEKMQSTAQELMRHSRMASPSLSGTVTVSAPPTVAALLIAPHIAQLRKQYPKLKVILLASSSLAALDKGEADIALRMVRPEENAVVRRKVGTVRFGLYASADYLECVADQWQLITYDKALEHVPQQSWLRQVHTGRSVSFEASDIFSQQAAARAGVGVVVLPTTLGDDDPELVRINLDTEPPSRDLWMVIYPDLQRSPAAQAVMTFLLDCIEREPRLRS